MLYQLTFGPHEESLIRQAERAGNPLPDSIANKPELLPGLDLYLEAFFNLDSERSHANGPTPIPFTAMHAYAVAFKFDDEQTEDLVFFLRVMDAANLKRVAKIQKTK